MIMKIYGIIFLFFIMHLSVSAQVPCVQSTRMVFSDITSSSANLTWIGPTLATRYAVLYKVAGDTIAPWMLTLTAANTVNLQNLSPFLCYEVMVQSTCEVKEITLNSAFTKVAFSTFYKAYFRKH